MKRKQRVALSIDRDGEQGIDPHDPSELSQPGHALEQAEQNDGFSKRSAGSPRNTEPCW